MTSVVRLKSSRRLELRRDTALSCTCAPSHGGHRRRLTAAGRGGGARRSVSRGSPRSGLGVTWLISIDERRRRSRPSIAPAARTSPGKDIPAARSRKQPRLTPVSTTSRWPCAARRRISASTAVGRAAAGGAAHERDDAERAGEGAAVLDPDEGAHPLESVVSLHAADRPHVGSDGFGDLLAAPGDDADVVGHPRECVLGEVGGAPRHVDVRVRAGGLRRRLARLRDGLVGDAARVDHGDVSRRLSPGCGRRRAAARGSPARRRTRPCIRETAS